MKLWKNLSSAFKNYIKEKRVSDYICKQELAFHISSPQSMAPHLGFL